MTYESIFLHASLIFGIIRLIHLSMQAWLIIKFLFKRIELINNWY